MPLLLLLVALFSIPGGLSDGGKVVWAYVSYALFSLAYSFVNIPYGSLSAAMTQEPDERAKLSTARIIAASLDDPPDRGGRLAPDLGRRRPAALADDHHDRLRGDRARALPVVLRHRRARRSQRDAAKVSLRETLGCCATTGR